MFKKILVSSIVIGFLANCAPAASSIGYIEVQKVFKEFKETSKAQEKISKQEEAFKKDFEGSQKKLSEAEKNGKGQEELDKMRKELETKLEPQRSELLKLNQELTTKLQGQIVAAVEKVAKKVGLDIVLDKQVVITGGLDLSDMVINELNK